MAYDLCCCWPASSSAWAKLTLRRYSLQQHGQKWHLRRDIDSSVRRSEYKPQSSQTVSLTVQERSTGINLRAVRLSLTVQKRSTCIVSSSTSPPPTPPDQSDCVSHSPGSRGHEYKPQISQTVSLIAQAAEVTSINLRWVRLCLSQPRWGLRV